MFRRILIANRGEIACRVIRTARRLGIAAVAVHSDADAAALHVRMADAAYAIGPAPPRESYLRIDAIIDAARRAGAEAIHPGYGFLSENADFAEACAAAGIVFIGPPPSAIRAMGSKSAAKALMERAGVPLVPGYHGEDQDAAHLAAEAAAIGFPVLIKASAGGGGRGMRVVADAAAFPEALAAAQREAGAAFGDDRVLVEKYLARPRHIEIQVFADSHGKTVSLFERDCSIQRRHQKVVEEAPAPGLDAAERAAMGEAAVAAARAVGYVGAGTVEFIAEHGRFYFMEMNTRLQVEHPVTECVTGLDLVEWQLRVAAGEALPAAPVAPQGHAIEVRICAEDPARDFLPATGTIQHLREPEGARIDTGVRQGDAITPYYDSMIAKLIVHGADRAEALRRLDTALGGYEIAGPATNLGLLRRIISHPDFAAGGVDTGFIATRAATLLAPEEAPADWLLAAAALHLLAAARAATDADPWSAADSWRVNAEPYQDLHFRLPGGDAITLRIHPQAAGARLDLPTGSAEAHLHDGALTLGAVTRRAKILRQGQMLTILLDGVPHRLQIEDPLAPPEGAAAGGARIASPIPARVTRVLVAVGDRVEAGAPLLVLEAMKMELTLRAPAAGTVAAMHAPLGTLVDEGKELIVLTPD
ncbi:acetyl-CoA carboxylase biotin carboxylase subunit [Roseomonas hellenica]|uniref:Acetyl-CoA carboxylase biotin carboxylase subunit n=1 Tax=Plastoroseomonas hellenica TaxID=2687306 RepID=A0ABS5EW23_9PROT|nr:acetyl-CoA carboxylase biotin carboxylase subunit [Plastoroseomonas hellenica]MBR0664496.1 acetyl-CoA carboxylase biotin carboxylase subunit [Plastoroseomonas hellenica]